MAVTGSLRDAHNPPPEQPSTSQALFRSLRLSLASGYYSMVQALGLKRLNTLLHGSSDPVWLLGVCYVLAPMSEDTPDEASTSGQPHNDHDDVLKRLVLDFVSRPWMTYRRGYPALGTDGLTSDVGWGCMLRSGQMMLAQALLHQHVGRDWRRSTQAPQPQDVDRVQHILSMFHDHPDDLFSIHTLCRIGQLFGVRVGEWLGPSVLCKTLEAAVNASTAVCGLRVFVVADPSGGAPTLYTSQLTLLTASLVQQNAPSHGLVLLVPLVLGIGTVNPAYFDQLLQSLEWPQSLGVVGGRPGSSLYFVGHQGQQLLYLDPHTVQEAVREPGLMDSYHCDVVAVMPMASIDPSLALAFYIASPASADDLVQRLRALEVTNKSNPMLCVRDTVPSWVNAAQEGAEAGVGEGWEGESWGGSPRQGDSNVDSWEMM